MAVPDTDDFTFQNVVTEIDPTTDDLVDCFADADSAKFDSSYSGTKNQLLNFRNYGAAPLTLFYGTLTNYSMPNFVCTWEISADEVLYHDGTNIIPEVGDTIYAGPTTNSQTVSWSMHKGFGDVEGDFSLASGRTNAQGVVTNTYQCS